MVEIEGVQIEVQDSTKGPQGRLTPAQLRYLVRDVSAEPVDFLSWRTETDLLLLASHYCPHITQDNLAVDPSTSDIF